MRKNRPARAGEAHREGERESWRVFRIMADVIFDHYATRGFEPSPEEARVMREL